MSTFNMRLHQCLISRMLWFQYVFQLFGRPHLLVKLLLSTFSWFYFRFVALYFLLFVVTLEHYYAISLPYIWFSGLSLMFFCYVLYIRIPNVYHRWCFVLWFRFFFVCFNSWFLKILIFCFGWFYDVFGLISG